MNLLDVEVLFNKTFDFEYFKHKTFSSIKEQIEDADNNYLKEVIDELPEDIKLKEFKIVYSKCKLIFNSSSSRAPYFFVRYDLIPPGKESPLYYYEIEFGPDGEVWDDYFVDYKDSDN